MRADVQFSFDVPKSGPRLSGEGRRFLIERLIAGDSNKEAVRALVDAGYPSVSRQTLAKFRCRPEVSKAFALKHAEVLQSGLALRWCRIHMLEERLDQIDCLLRRAESIVERANHEDRSQEETEADEQFLQILGKNGYSRLIRESIAVSNQIQKLICP